MKNLINSILSNLRKYKVLGTSLKNEDRPDEPKGTPMKYYHKMSYKEILFMDKETKEYYKKNPDELDKFVQKVEKLFIKYKIKKVPFIYDALDRNWTKENSSSYQQLHQ